MDGDAVMIVIGVVAAAACVANWWSRAADHRGVEAITKPLATVALAALAVAAAAGDGSDAPDGAVVAAIVAFALCLAGDVALLPAVDRFVLGLASFLLGHLAFVVMFVLLGLDRPALALVAAVGVGAVVATAGRRIVTGARSQAAALVRPVQAYLAVIASMALVGWATGRPAAMAGSALFVASDAVLGWNRFVGERRWMPVTVMVTYHGALAGLALSLR